jgi:hypothetical protein
VPVFASTDIAYSFQVCGNSNWSSLLSNRGVFSRRISQFSTSCPKLSVGSPGLRPSSPSPTALSSIKHQPVSAERLQTSPTLREHVQPLPFLRTHGSGR